MTNKRIKMKGFQADFMESKARYPAMISAWGTGKLLSLDEEVKVLGGWKRMGDIVAGDIVYNLTGNLVKVLVAHNIVDVSKAYKLRFDSGEEILCDPRHLWYTIDNAENQSIVRGRRKKGSVKTTQQIVDTLKTKDDYCSNHRIPVCGAFFGEKKKLPIMPYTFGAWLGDGTSREMSITNEDFEVLESIALDGYIVTPRKCKSSNIYGISNGANSHRHNGKTLTEQLGLLGVRQNKYIPEIYQNAIVEQRMELLRGLMDTDGYVDGRDGICEYTSINKRLAEDVCELVNGLGIKARIYTGRATIDGKDCGEKYRVAFKTKKRIFNIERKQSRIDSSTANQLSRRNNRWIVGYEVVNNVKMRCLTVDSEDGLFLVTRSFIATHNSMFACCLKPVLECQKYPGNQWLIVRKEMTRLEDSTIPDFEGYTGLKVGSDHNVKIRNKEWPADASDSVIMFRHGEQINKSEVLQNMNLGGFSIEQAEEFETDREFQMLRGRLRRAGIPHYGCISANTKGHNWLYKYWKLKDLPKLTVEVLKELVKETGLTEGQLRDAYDPNHYALFEATTFDNKSNLSLDFIQDIARLKVESPHHYNRFVMNSWEDVDTEDKVIPYSHIMSAVGRKLIELRQKTLVACDPCEMGGDLGVVYGLKNGEIVRHDFFYEKDGSQIAAKCQIMRKEIKGQTTVLDNIGIGASTRDFLNKMNEPIVLADSRKTGSRQEDKFTGYFNQRAEMWWAAKKMFAEGMVSIPDDPELIEELAAVGFELTPKGYKVESKEKLKKADRLGRSPNKADCLVYGLWGLGKIEFDDEAVYPDDDDFFPAESDVADSYSIRTAV